MPTPCNNHIQIVQSEDICQGETKPASCVLDSSIYAELGLEANSSQQQINQAQYLAALNIKATIENIDATVSGLDGSETKIEAGDNVEITGSGTTLNPYIVSGQFSPLDKINEGNGEGIIIRGRAASNYGNIGSNAVDLSEATLPFNDKGAMGQYSFTANKNTLASGENSAAFCEDSVASGYSSFAINMAKAIGYHSFASGSGEARGTFTHAEGAGCIAEQQTSHAEGNTTKATGLSSHSQNDQTEAQGFASDASGYITIAAGDCSTSGGRGNTANSYIETTVGSFGTVQVGTALLDSWIPTERLYNIGNGVINPSTSVITRSDAFTLLKNGLATLPSVTNTLISAASGKAVITKEYLPTVGGNYANDTAAAIGGIAVGQMYHTAGTVKIRLV